MNGSNAGYVYMALVMMGSFDDSLSSVAQFEYFDQSVLSG